MEDNRNCCQQSRSYPIPHYHGIIQSKKATLVLLWSTAIHWFYILFIVSPLDIKYAHVASNAIFGVLLMLYPLSGWLADVYLTRYRTMYIGLWLVAVGAVITTVVRYTYPQLELLGFIVVAIGQALFEINAIQFGLDQLQTYSTDNHQAFIYWFYFTMEIGHFVYGMCLCGVRTVYDRYTSINATAAAFSIIQTLALAVIAVQACLWKNKFHHHQTGFHPFKQIFQVINYARKKRVSTRSAFQYTDGEVAGIWLDRAKSKFGGIFTTEQVEDVKVFFYLLFILIPLSVTYYVDESYSVAKQFQDANDTINTISYNKCLLTEVSTWPRSAIAIILLPLYIFVISRIIKAITHKYLLLWRMGFGLGIALLSIIAFFAIQLKVTITRINGNNNSTLEEMMENNYTECYAGDIVNFNWLAIPEILNSLSFVIVFSTTLEFICAQSPHSTKGFLIGLWFSFQGIDRIILSIQQGLQLDCTFGYYIAKGLIMTGFIGLYVFAAKQYRYRKRQDRNTRSILEDYYSQQEYEDISSNSFKNDILSESDARIMDY